MTSAPLSYYQYCQEQGPSGRSRTTTQPQTASDNRKLFTPTGAGTGLPLGWSRSGRLLLGVILSKQSWDTEFQSKKRQGSDT